MSGYRFYQFWQTIIVVSDFKKKEAILKNKRKEKGEKVVNGISIKARSFR